MNAPVHEPSLAALVAPVPAPEFLARSWKKAVFHAGASRERLAPFLAALGPADVASLLERSRQFVAMQEGVPIAAPLARAEALAAYEASGATLYFRMNEDFALCRWSTALARDLGELPTGVTSFFAVRGRHGTAAHLDWNENFTLQLRGRKRWRVAAARDGFLPHPVTNWVVGDPAPLHSDATRMPARMPENASEFVLEPGALLYVPRGLLHQVSSVDEAESLSLNLSFPPAPWAVVLCTLLSSGLLEDPAFREGLTGAFGAGWGREDVLARLPAMLAVLEKRAAGLGESLREVMDDPARLADYLARRGYPKL